MALITPDLAKKEAVTFVEMFYGSSPTYVRYCDADEDTTFESNTYTSRPDLEVVLPTYTGMMQEKTCDVVLPIVTAGVTDSFVNNVSGGRAFSPITVRVVVRLVSYTPGSPVNYTQELFYGRVGISVRNYRNRKNQVALKCVTWKQESDRPCGFQANPQCYFQFQGRGCVVDSPPGSGTYISAVTPSSPASRAVTILSISRDLVTLTATPSGGPFTDYLFHRGYMELDGLKIGIREWDYASPTQFLMERPPPSSWSGAGVNLYQGCDKTLLTCMNRYGNDDFFGGFGAGIRDYNPVFEVRD